MAKVSAIGMQGAVKNAGVSKAARPADSSHPSNASTFSQTLTANSANRQAPSTSATQTREAYKRITPPTKTNDQINNNYNNTRQAITDTVNKQYSTNHEAYVRMREKFHNKDFAGDMADLWLKTGNIIMDGAAAARWSFDTAGSYFDEDMEKFKNGS